MTHCVIESSCGIQRIWQVYWQFFCARICAFERLDLTTNDFDL